MHDPLCVAFEIRRPIRVTVWHREPGGADSGTVCPYRTHWRHPRHWKIQIHRLQHWRRRFLTRCEWCGGKQGKRDAINIGSWNAGSTSHWWQGETGLQHHDCDMVWRAHERCLCDDPLLAHGQGSGHCALCGKFRAWGNEPNDADRLLASIPEGGRIPVDMRPKLEAVWHPALRERGIDPATTVAPW
jgi:hypothetical protein